MPITSVDQWSETADSNTDIAGFDIGENCSPAGINNAIRNLMAQVAATPLATFMGEFDTVSLLIADTARTYSNTTAGDYIRTRAEGFSYLVAASGASDHHVTTGGGLKLYVLPGAEGFNPMAFGANGLNGASDSAELQAAITAGGNYSVSLGKQAFLPTGLYQLSTTLTPSGYSTIEGCGPYASMFYNESAAIPTVPVFNPTTALLFAGFEKLGARGQKSFIECDMYIDNCRFSDISLYGMADCGFRFQGDLYTSEFHRVVIEASPKGIVCETLANCNTFYDLELKNLTDDGITLNGSEGLVFVSPRIEGSTVSSKAMFKLASGANHVLVKGGYFEGAHEYLVDGTTATGEICFDGSHFTYYQTGVPYKFNAANVVMTFRDCHATQLMIVPANSILEGNNINIQVAQGGASIRSKNKRGGVVDLKITKGTGTTLDADLVTFTRGSAAAATANQQTVFGTLTVGISGFTGGFPQVMTKEYLVVVRGAFSFNVEITAQLIATADSSGGAFGAAITTVSQTTTAATLHVQATGLQNAVENAMSASFEWSSNAYTESNEFTVTFP